MIPTSQLRNHLGLETTGNTERPRRRRGPDLRLRLVRWLAAASWLLLLVSAWVVDRARPEPDTFLDRHFGLEVRSWWDEGLAELGFWMVLGNLGLCLLGLALNYTRRRRQGDRLSPSLLLLGAVSTVALFFYWTRSF